MKWHWLYVAKCGDKYVKGFNSHRIMWTSDVLQAIELSETEWAHRLGVAFFQSGQVVLLAYSHPVARE